MIDRRRQKEEARAVLRTAVSSPWIFSLVFLLITGVLTLVNDYTSGSFVTSLQRIDPSIPIPAFLQRAAAIPRPAVIFVSIFVPLCNALLSAGSNLYHLGIRSAREMPLSTLFDGFGQAGRIIVLALLQYIFIFLWSMLFIIPGIIAAYRYRFAMYDLLENPELSPMEALRMSSAQTYGYKTDLFVMDLSFLGWYILAALTLGILSIWVTPYHTQTEVGYFRTAKRTKGIGYLPPEDRPAPDNGQDPFGPSV